MIPSLFWIAACLSFLAAMQLHTLAICLLLILGRPMAACLTIS